MVAIAPLLQLGTQVAGGFLAKQTADKNRKDAERAAALQAFARTRAGDIKSQAFTEAGDVRAAGFGEAGDVLNQLRARFSGLSDDIVSRGEAAAGGIGAGLPETRSDIDALFGQGRLDTLDPAISGGVDATQLLNAALGASGGEAQEEFFRNFQDDPGFQSLQDTGIETIEGSRSAGGALRSGGTLKELFGFGQRLKSDFLRDRLTRLESARGSGINATNLLNQILQGRAGTELGLGQLGLSAEQASANTLLSTINQQLQSEGLGAKATGAFADTLTGAAGARANAITGSARARAAGVIGSQDSLISGLIAGANQRTALTDNLLKLGGSAQSNIGDIGTDFFKRFRNPGANPNLGSFAF